MSSNEIAIRVTNLSKRYEIYDTPRDRLKQFVISILCRAIPALRKFLPGPSLRSPHTPLPTFYKEFWALKDVSFEVKKGETVDIIGRNGSGKSTLLQTICGTLLPTSGSVETRGRIAALLELGSGFSHEFTGRENVYMNAAMLGLSKEEVDARFDDTADFLYKTTDYYAPEHEHCIAWSDPAIAIQWPLDGESVLSAKDQQGKSLAEAEHFA